MFGVTEFATHDDACVAVQQPGPAKPAYALLGDLGREECVEQPECGLAEGYVLGKGGAQFVNIAPAPWP